LQYNWIQWRILYLPLNKIIDNNLHGGRISVQLPNFFYILTSLLYFLHFNKFTFEEICSEEFNYKQILGISFAIEESILSKTILWTIKKGKLKISGI